MFNQNNVIEMCYEQFEEYLGTLFDRPTKQLFTHGKTEKITIWRWGGWFSKISAICFSQECFTFNCLHVLSSSSNFIYFFKSSTRSMTLFRGPLYTGEIQKKLRIKTNKFYKYQTSHFSILCFDSIFLFLFELLYFTVWIWVLSIIIEKYLYGLNTFMVQLVFRPYRYTGTVRP